MEHNKEFLNLILDRRSCRNYRPDPLDRPTLAAIVEAGRYAPSAMNRQLNHFYVITNPDTLAAITATVSRRLEGFEGRDCRYGATAGSTSPSAWGMTRRCAPSWPPWASPRRSGSAPLWRWAGPPIRSIPAAESARATPSPGSAEIFCIEREPFPGTSVQPDSDPKHMLIFQSQKEFLS